MKKTMIQYIVAAHMALLALFGIAVMTALPVNAATPADQITEGVNKAGGANQTSLGDQIKRVVNILLFIIGVVSVIMIIIGGIKYVLSNGDSSQITSAKNTILYAVIGLVVALLAYAIVNFVVTQFA